MCWSRLLLTPIYKRWIVKPKKKKHRELLVLVCILDSFRFWEDSIYLVRMQRQEGRMEDLLREPSKIDLSQYPFFRESLKFGHSFFKGLRPSGRGVNEIIMKVGLSLDLWWKALRWRSWMRDGRCSGWKRLSFSWSGTIWWESRQSLFWMPLVIIIIIIIYPFGYKLLPSRFTSLFFFLPAQPFSF